MRALGIVALLALSSLGAVARAEVISTHAVEVQQGELGNCRFTNLATRPVDVTVEHVDASGAVTNRDHFTVGADGTHDDFSGTGDSSTFRCRFSGSFKRIQARALVAVFAADAKMRLAIPAD